MGLIRVGTSGFSYQHWRRVFYPEGLPEPAWLSYYANVFSTVELNTTFYRLPSPEAVDRWREATPNGFLFAAKGSRYLTHVKRLTEVGLGLIRYFDVLTRLGQKLGPVLWQLPPTMTKADPLRLSEFLEHLPDGIPQVFEFRAEGWYTNEICEVLDRHGAAFCEHDLLAIAPPRPTGGFRYLRFHGANAPYRGRYGRRTLAKTARSLAEWASQGRRAFVYFNNDAYGYALSDALDLIELVGGSLGSYSAQATP